ncbi:MAG: lytic transglycosylase domain-containing protein [Thermodesulfobacteriota bacterium]|nr:lytic transglycosylase domain-containing protein [Thermodesulfobacteriota bacterium]
MDEDPFNIVFSTNLTRWFCIAFLLFFVAVLPPHEGENSGRRVAQEQAVCSVNTPSSLQEATPGSSGDRPQSLYRKKSKALFDGIVFQAASRHQVDPALIKAIIMAESGYDPMAVSRKGASGLMQLMPRTAEALGVKDVFDPEHNINGGVKYFKLLLEQFNGEIRLALAAYNAGSSRVRQYQGVPPIKSTQYYVKKVFEYYQYYREEMIRDRATGSA